MDEAEFLSQLEGLLQETDLSFLVAQERLAAEEGVARSIRGDDASGSVAFESLSTRERIAFLLDLITVAVEGDYEVCREVRSLRDLSDDQNVTKVVFAVPSEDEGSLSEVAEGMSGEMFDHINNPHEIGRYEKSPPSLEELSERKQSVEEVITVVKEMRDAFELKRSPDLKRMDSRTESSSEGWLQ